MHVLLIHQQPVQLMKLLYQAFAQLPNMHLLDAESWRVA